MKAVVIQKPGELALKDVDIPVPPKGFARIKVKAAAICATDLEIIDGNIPANYPIIPGHEWSGTVDCVGDEADAHWVGKNVVGSNDVVCLRCEACLNGNWRYCESFEEIGFRRNGAYAEYVIVPVYGLCEKPDNISFEHAALCEPLGVALGTFKKAKAKSGDTLLIMGAGSIGLSMLAVGKAMGMRKIVVCATKESRLRTAKAMGAYATVATSEENIETAMKKLHPGGTDLIIDATGIEECIQSCLRIAKRGGTVMLAGYGRGKTISIRMDDIHVKNLKVIGAGNNWNMFKKAVNLMEEGLVDLSCFITHRLCLDEFDKGLDMARRRPDGFIKAVFINE
ncbi:MAG: alcohol dehydrogenase catalytic domain-containing protein [Clostridia bacterium]|nr:alcohol dehydrogenase catalytic domain-containing protein [Clostridia bacterium]